MLLTPAEAKLFFKLYWTLLFFVNDRLQVLPNKLASPDEIGHQHPEAVLQVRNALVKEIDLIESFVDQNPAHFSEEEIGIVLSWRHLVDGTFYIVRELKKYTVFTGVGHASTLRRIAQGIVGWCRGTIGSSRATRPSASRISALRRAGSASTRIFSSSASIDAFDQRPMLKSPSPLPARGVWNSRFSV